MSNLVPFESGNVPAHIARRFADVGTNNDLAANVGGGGFPVISYKGKVWHVVRGDERTLVANEDGDPKSSIEVVILKANPNLSKIYYQSGYEEGSSAKPTCYSNDGQGPARDAAEPQASKCAICPHNAWGSRVTENGAKGKACSDSRRLAVAPIGDLENPMLLRIPAATLKELTAYAELLNRRRAPYQAVVTKIGFDHTVAHQKLTFKPLRWLTDEEADLVAEVTEREVIRNIVGLEADLDLEGAPPARFVEQPAQVAAPVAPKPVKKPVAKYEATEDDIDAVLAPPPPPPAPVEEAVVEAAPAPKAKKPDVSAIIAEADASLDEVLGMLDD